MDDYTIYSEFDIFPGGLPDIEDIKLKKRKNNDEKGMFEDCNNPPGTPEKDFSSQVTVNTQAGGISKSISKLNLTNAEFEMDDVDEFVLDQVVKEALDGGY